MEEMTLLIGLLLLVLVSPWFLAWRSIRKRRRDRAEDQSRLQELTNRVFALELSLQELGTRPNRSLHGSQSRQKSLSLNL